MTVATCVKCGEKHTIDSARYLDLRSEEAVERLAEALWIGVARNELTLNSTNGAHDTRYEVAARAILAALANKVEDHHGPEVSQDCGVTAGASTEHHRYAETFGHVCLLLRGHAGDHECICGDQWWLGGPEVSGVRE